MKIWKPLDVSKIEKSVRARVIKRHMEAYGYKLAVCFSCGNATRELKNAGVDLLAISPGGDLLPNRWFTMAEITVKFPGYFDATSGHLSIALMNEIARQLKYELNLIPGEFYDVPTGSGETIICLAIAFPQCKFRAVYDDNDPATAYEPNAPLNWLIASTFETKMICKN